MVMYGNEIEGLIPQFDCLVLLTLSKEQLNAMTSLLYVVDSEMDIPEELKKKWMSYIGMKEEIEDHSIVGMTLKEIDDVIEGFQVWV